MASFPRNKLRSIEHMSRFVPRWTFTQKGLSGLQFEVKVFPEQLKRMSPQTEVFSLFRDEDPRSTTCGLQLHHNLRTLKPLYLR